MKINTKSVIFRLNLILLVLISLLLGVTGTFNYLKTRSDLNNRLDFDATNALERMNLSLPSALWNFDQTSIGQIVSAEMKSNQVQAIVVSTTKEAIAGFRRKDSGDIDAKSLGLPKSGDVREIQLFFTDGNEKKPVGKVTMEISHAAAEAEMRSLLWQQVIQFMLVVLTLIVALSLTLIQVLIKPLRKVSAVFDRVADGELNVAIEIKREDEIGQLSLAVQKMIARLSAVIRETQQVVGAAAIGDLSKRVTLADKQGFGLDLGSSINQLAETSATVMSDVGRVLNVMADGD